MKDHISGNVLPGYLKASILLLGLTAFFYIIWAAQSLILPFVFSVLVAVLLDPVINFLTRKKMNRMVAIAITLVVALLLMAGLVFFIVSQFHSFAKDLPALEDKFKQFFSQATNWIAQTFRMDKEEVNAFIEKEKGEGMSNSGKAIGNAALKVSRFFVVTLLIPVYLFLILYYKQLLLKGITMFFPHRLHGEVVNVLHETRTLVFHYLTGLLIEMGIMAVLSSLGLSLIGIQSAILFGIMAALLNTIPYVGVLITNISMVAIALVTKGPTSALLVFILFAVIQFIDNNIVVPRIVGSKVKINALATILIVLIGGALCGVAGMFLAIPVLGILKVVFDRIPGLAPLGYLLGDTPQTENHRRPKGPAKASGEKKSE